MLDGGITQRLGPAPLLLRLLRLTQFANVTLNILHLEGVGVAVAKFTFDHGDEIEIFGSVLLSILEILDERIEKLADGSGDRPGFPERRNPTAGPSELRVRIGGHADGQRHGIVLNWSLLILTLPAAGAFWRGFSLFSNPRDAWLIGTRATVRIRAMSTTPASAQLQS